jgi:hypothetical protein
MEPQGNLDVTNGSIWPRLKREKQQPSRAIYKTLQDDSASGLPKNAFVDAASYQKQRQSKPGMTCFRQFLKQRSQGREIAASKSGQTEEGDEPREADGRFGPRESSCEESYWHNPESSCEFHNRCHSKSTGSKLRCCPDDGTGVVNRQSRPKPELILAEVHGCSDYREHNSAIALSVKMVPMEAANSSLFGFVMGARAAITLPPQIAVPALMRNAAFGRTLNMRPSHNPATVAMAMLTAV